MRFKSRIKICLVEQDEQENVNTTLMSKKHAQYAIDHNEKQNIITKYRVSGNPNLTKSLIIDVLVIIKGILLINHHLHIRCLLLFPRHSKSLPEILTIPIFTVSPKKIRA